MRTLYSFPLNRVTIAVTAITTQIFAPVFVGGVDEFEIELLNDDPTQIFTGILEQSAAQAGPFDLYDDATFSNMDPAASPSRAALLRIFNSQGQRWIKFVGTASGAGFNVRVSLKLYKFRDLGVYP